MSKHFTVAFDPDFQTWIVISTETKAASFAMIPAAEAWEFSTKLEALEQAARLSGSDIKLRMIETPGRFEVVADTRYGAAWGAA